ncbi:hypothetical protein [Qipengyuania gaetbuli]|uniref:hypothetical protein n=1 Tax=Qipengyuania gaetbuli TaxID=266952 RepID=UPI001CFE06B3|nr:hypothetical protein [Qipengyuania gaetbuli]
MSDSLPLQAPGGFAPLGAVGIDDGTGHLATVSRASPLPVTTVAGSTSDPLEGAITATGLAGPFHPSSLDPVYCTLAGEFTGTVRVMRSLDGGETLHPLTAGGLRWAEFAGPACEPVWIESEQGASLWLDCTLSSGTLEYRLSQ